MIHILLLLIVGPRTLRANFTAPRSDNYILRNRKSTSLLLLFRVRDARARACVCKNTYFYFFFMYLFIISLSSVVQLLLLSYCSHIYLLQDASNAAEYLNISTQLAAAAFRKERAETGHTGLGRAHAKKDRRNGMRTKIQD